MSIPFYDEQVRFLFDIAAQRNKWLDPLFQLLYYFDTPYFLMLLIPFVWVGCSAKWGMRLGFLIIVNGLVNFHLKHLLNMPRPIVDYPELAMFPLTSPGMPSGAAQQAVLLSGLLIMAWKSKWAWLIAAIATLLIGFSRLYVGVHYPMDILGGWAAGLGLFALFFWAINPLEKFLSEQGRGLGLVLCCAISAFYLYFLPIPFIYELMGAWLGLGIGAYFSLQNKLYDSYPNQLSLCIYRGIAAVLSLLALFSLLRHQPFPFLVSLILALWISLGAHLFCRFLNLQAKREPHRRAK